MKKIIRIIKSNAKNNNDNKIKEELLSAINRVEECLSLIKETLPFFYISNGETSNNIAVSDFVSQKIIDMKSHSFLNKGKPYSTNSIQNWAKFKKVWNSFTSDTYNKTLTFENITISTYYDFMSYCDFKSFRKSTKYLYASLFKAAMSYAFLEDISVNRIFANRNFMTHSSCGEHNNIYLTNYEIEKIAGVHLNEKSTLDKVRDIFLIGCYTGQRVSDYASLSIDDFENIEVDGKKYQVIKKKQKKTGSVVIIPILSNEVMKILLKWGGKLPKIATSTLNSRIKTVCRLAGITDLVKKYDTIGGKEIEIITTKNQLVSSHTARRSCITNLYMDRKLDIVQIRSISGHKSEQAFNRYLCYSSEECAKQIIESINN